MFVTEVAWSQIIGTRDYQQDHAAITSWPNGFRLLLLADGMGGHAAGDVASQAAVEAFKTSFIHSDESNMRRRLIAGLDAANLRVYNDVQQDKSLAGMGTTLIAVVYDGLSIQWLSVGDSPMWLVRDKQLRRLNANHSMAEVLDSQAAAGEISEQSAANSPVRSQLLEAVMGEDIKMVDAPSQSVPVQEGDWLLLASDGVESCPEQDILQLTDADTAAVDELVNNVLAAVTAQGRESQDNATLVAMHVMSANTQEPDTVQPAGDDILSEPKTERQ